MIRMRYGEGKEEVTGSEVIGPSKETEEMGEGNKLVIYSLFRRGFYLKRFTGN